MNKKDLPHLHTFARLGVSKIEGIGVFAIRDIPKGTNIFSDDKLPVEWFDKSTIDLEATDPEIKKYYSDFCVVKNGMYGCPVSFNSMTLGWYMNEPVGGKEANVTVGDNYDFFASRDILKGEELTTRYSDFSEPLERY